MNIGQKFKFFFSLQFRYWTNVDFIGLSVPSAWTKLQKQAKASKSKSRQKQTKASKSRQKQTKATENEPNFEFSLIKVVQYTIPIGYQPTKANKSRQKQAKADKSNI